jgi:16S rRNA (cytosine967-C5)-methyltransferase
VALSEAGAGLAPREAALGLLHAVLHEGQALSEARLPATLAGPGRARAHALAEAVLRRLGQIDALVLPWLDHAPPRRLVNILRLAGAELLVLGTAPHAAVDSAVRLAEAAPKTRHLKGLANAVARRIDREGRALWAAQDAAALALPDWLARRLLKDWGPEAARAIASAGLVVPPLDLTPRDPASAAGWADRLGAKLLPTGSLRQARAGQVTELPGYAEGAWWVQDAAAALPVRLLGEVRGREVLDLCAAPGGKTLQLAAMGARVTALDLKGPRLGRLRENLARTGLTAGIIAADALAWTPPAPLEAILLDAPCSATGTFRRHPDVLRRRAAPDLGALTALQDQLLDRAFSWLAPGGRLVFATCSLLKTEGEARLAHFLRRHEDAALAPPLPAPPSTPGGLEPGWLEGGALRTRPDFWPGTGGMDGFFAAAIVRKA